jgi:hypothetical protein
MTNLTLPILDGAEGQAWWQSHQKWFYGPNEGKFSAHWLEVS